MSSDLIEKLVVSKKRVVEHGEVYTSKRIVNAMLDLVKQETENIDSRFLEPACGTGNFLVEILERKLSIVESRYKKSQIEYERYAVRAVSSLYGIDIRKDNVAECRERLFFIFNEHYGALYKKKVKKGCQRAVKYILSRNIIHGDALSLKTISKSPKPIVFSEWSFVKGSMIKRRDFAFHELLPRQKDREQSLFSEPNLPECSDMGKAVFIPTPLKEYPVIHYMRITDV